MAIPRHRLEGFISLIAEAVLRDLEAQRLGADPTSDAERSSAAPDELREQVAADVRHQQRSGLLREIP